MTPPRARFRLRLAGLAFFAAVGLAAHSRGQQNPPARPPNPNEAVVPPEKLDTVTGFRLSSEEDYAAYPAAAATADGTVWTAWVRYREGKGDEVVARSLPMAQAGKGRIPVRIDPPRVLSPAPGQYIRPVLAAAGGEGWGLWPASEPARPSAIWFTRCTRGEWSPAARLLPDENRSQQNPEAAAAPDGRLAVVYQLHTGAGFDVHLRQWDGQTWTPPRSLSDGATDDWDPVVAFDAKGALHAAWSGWKDGDYDVYWVARDGAPRRISARGEYDLHPWLAASPNGEVWVSWDVVRVPAHGRSGRTTITGANLRPGDPETVTNASGLWSGVEVRVILGDTLLVPGRPREEIVAPKGYHLAHRALGKVAIGPAGEPWIIYRALFRMSAPWSAAVRDGYMWELQARPFRNGRWEGPVLFLESDGYLEEPGMASTPAGIRVAYGTEHRRSSARRVMFHEPHGEGYDHRHDFDGFMGWRGDVYLATLEPPAVPWAPEGNFTVERAPADRPCEKYLPREAGRHDVTAGGKTLHLYWGDTHKHSNVSRCTVGSEPSPDDLYRYGTDINRYGFFALSDHAEYTTDYYWWKQQKLADLHHVPGFLSVLYNYEWSLRFPDGHHNTLFPRRPAEKIHGWMGASKDLKGGWRILEKHGTPAITIPHTGADPGMGTDWSAHDERYRRLCEIFQSARGSYEHEGCPREFTNTRNKKGFYWSALEKGYHVGVIASSDHGYGCAYACVYAPENTREAIWRAMWERRTYGSTAYGLVLELRSGARWMGEEWASAEAPALEIYVRGAAPIRSIEILGRSKVLHAEGSLKAPLDKAEHRIRWTDPEWARQTKEQWYYVRVIQTDDEMAWSSPVWITPKP